MQRYVLTERGKILVAMLIVFLLILPSVILVAHLTNKDSAPHNSDADGSDLNPLVTPDLTQVLPPADDNPGALFPALAGPIEFDLEAGTMTFLYAADLQSKLDENTVSMIGELLTSPQNISGTRIAIDIPQLSDNDTNRLTSAIIDAFHKYNVPTSDIIFFVYIPNTETQIYEIKISFRG